MRQFTPLSLILLLSLSVTLAQEIEYDERYIGDEDVYLRKGPNVTVVGVLVKNRLILVIKSPDAWKNVFTYGVIENRSISLVNDGKIGIVRSTGTKVYDDNLEITIAYLNAGTEVAVFEDYNSNNKKIAVYGWVKETDLSSDRGDDRARTEKSIYQIGDEIEFEGGIFLVHGIRVTAEETVKWDFGETILVLPEGGDYLIIDLSISNKSPQELHLTLGYCTLKVVDDEGRTYSDESISAAFDGIKKDETFSSVPAGEKRRGEFAFNIPKGNHAHLYVTIKFEMFGGTEENFKVNLY